MNLTNRQKELIEDLLSTYQFYCRESEYVMKEDKTDFNFNGKVYMICDTDYKEVCEIIDYIKGVKNNENRVD